MKKPIAYPPKNLKLAPMQAYLQVSLLQISFADAIKA